MIYIMRIVIASVNTCRIHSTCFALLAFAFATQTAGQQLPDTTFRFQNSRPAFAEGTGPVVCVDAAHRNFHQLDSTYYAFGALVRGDGFRTVNLRDPLDAGIPPDCAVLVIASAAATLAENEVGQLLKWIVRGGGFLLVMDHAPYPRFAERLSTALGAAPFNGGATYRMFGTLPDQPILALAARPVLVSIRYGARLVHRVPWVTIPSSAADPVSTGPCRP